MMGLAERMTPEQLKEANKKGVESGTISQALANFSEEYQKEGRSAGANFADVVGTGGIIGAGTVTGSLLGRVADKATGGLLSEVFSAKGTVSMAGKVGTDADVSTSTSGSRSSNSANTYGVAFSDSDSLTNSSQSVRSATEGVKTSLNRIASDSQGRIASREDSGTITFSNNNTVSDRNSAGVQAQYNVGSKDAEMMGGVYAQVARDARNPVPVQNEMRDKMEGLQSRAQGMFDQATNKSAGAGGSVQMPTAPGLAGGDMGAARGAQGAALGTTGAPQLREAGAVPSKSAPQGGGDVLANRAMASDADRTDQFAGKYAAQIDSLAKSAGNVSRYGIPMTGGLGRIGNTGEALEEGFRAAYNAEVAASGGRATAGALSLAGFSSIQTTVMASKGGAVNAVRDTATGAEFKMVASEDSSQRIVLPGERNAQFGEFLKSDQARLIGVNNKDYEGLSAQEAVAKYDASPAGQRNAAAESKYASR